MNDAAKKRSALAFTSLAPALLAGLCFIIILYSARGEAVFYVLLGGGLLSFFITSTGVVAGSIALYRRGVQIGWMGLAGLAINILSLFFSVFLILVACFVYLFKDMGRIVH
jgi:hypothetical protein